MKEHVAGGKMTRRMIKDAMRVSLEAHKQEPAFKRASRIDLAVSLLITLLIAMSIRLFIFEPVRVEGPSMLPTLFTNERMIVEKLSYGFTAPKRGEIIICRYPGYTESCVKRVVGLPGETLEVRNGRVYINGEKLDESAYWNDLIWSDMSPVTIPQNSVFVIGDNRNQSLDSRSASVGPIPYSRIIGRVRGVMWPLANAQIF